MVYVELDVFLMLLILQMVKERTSTCALAPLQKFSYLYYLFTIDLREARDPSHAWTGRYMIFSGHASLTYFIRDVKYLFSRSSVC